MAGVLVMHGQLRPNISPAPNTASLGRYIDNPVAYYTGIPNISVPLYEINEKNFNLPVSLSYHAGGIKVEDHASNVGLGWVLNAGGAVTRVIKDIPDDFKGYFGSGCNYVYPYDGPGQHCRNGLLHSGVNISDIDLEYAYQKDLTDINFSYNNVIDKLYLIRSSGGEGLYTYFKDVDSEPDVYYFNFCGFTGQFIFQVIDGAPTVKFLSHYDLRVQYYLDTDGQLGKFEFIDNMGNKYVFDQIEKQSTLTYKLINGMPVNEISYGNFSAFSFNGTSSEVRTGWYLSKIVTTSGANIDFNYETEQVFWHNMIPEQNCNWIPDWEQQYSTYNPNTPGGPFFYLTQIETRNYSKRLTSIQSPTIKIEFESALQRLDLASTSTNTTEFPRAITGLTVFGKKSTTFERLKRFRFDQDYFETTPTQTHCSLGGENFLITGTDNRNLPVIRYFKRLRLKNVQELGITDNCTIPSTSFEYRYKDFPGFSNDDELPYKYSGHQDLWGYYNAATENTHSLMPALYIYPDMFNDSRQIGVYKRNNFNGREYILPGANRQTNPDKMQVGMLTKINYPTGGFTKYEYEANKFKDVDEEFIGGGLRIKQITKSDAAYGQPIVYNYSYLDENNLTSGRVISIPQYANARAIVRYHPLDGSEASFKSNTDRFSSSQAALGSTKGSSVGYRKVSESISGNGKTEFQFSMPATWFEANDADASIPGGDCTLTENGICDNLYAATKVTTLFPGTPMRNGDYYFTFAPASINSYPYAENPNYDWARGHILKKNVFAEDGRLLLSEAYNYKNWIYNGMTAPTKVYGVKIGEFLSTRKPVNSSPNSPRVYSVFRGGRYFYLTDIAKVLSSKTTTQYATDGTQVAIVTTENYKHDGLGHMNTTQVSVSTSTADELITKTKYPLDYQTTGLGGQEGISPLKAKGMWAVPVESSSFVKKGGTEYLKSASLSSYDWTSNYIPFLKREFKIENTDLITNFIPSYTSGTQWQLVKDARYIEQGQVTRHDVNGNPLEVVGKGGQTISYIWGYNNGKYPVAKIENATYDQVEAILSSGVREFIFKGYDNNNLLLTDQQLRNFISQIRASLSSALVTTYTYSPFIGLTSETTPSGMTTYYEYDCLNRLTLIKDHFGKVLKQNTYGIQTQ